MARPSAPPPSIARRLARALLGWALAWGVAMGLAIWLAAAHEVDELLDETLLASAELMTTLVAGHDETVPRPVGGEAIEHFAWQLVSADGRLLRRSALAPPAPWHARPRTGFVDLPEWRVLGMAAGRAGQVLYVAQTRAERDEARGDVALGATLAALAVGLLGQLWLRARVRHELQPLERLSRRLADWPLPQGTAIAPLGAAERVELIPVHAALDALAARLATRLASEQAFSAHAAHALRTPLAGIDAQLAVAARQAPPELAERLVRVRGAAARLQHVVAALLGLFRSADGLAALRREAVRLDDLVQRLPPFALAVEATPGAELQADADLLTAALLNLLDNAQRHGAHTVRLALAEGGRVLQVRDDGRGLPPDRLAHLAQALADERYADAGGLGLMLADRVARAHGGRLTLPAVTRGFAVDLDLGPR